MPNKAEIRAASLTSQFARNEHGGAAVRIALLFGFIALGFAVMLTPLAERTGKRMADSGVFGGPEIVTGSIEEEKTYQVYRSVLQENPSEGCTIFENGKTAGNC